MPLFDGLTAYALESLAGALHIGKIGPPFDSLAMSTYVPAVNRPETAQQLQSLVTSGWESGQLVTLLMALAHERRRQTNDRMNLQLVWSGPESVASESRDTSIVVRDLFRQAERTVLVAGFAVHQGKTIFQDLAVRMDSQPALQVSLILNVHRPAADMADPVGIVSTFAKGFLREQWPGKRHPDLYYDPRSLDPDPGKRAVLHAKCLVIDSRTALVSSANFTEAAQLRNIEAGVLIQNEAFATSLVGQFTSLISAGVLQRLQ